MSVPHADVEVASPHASQFACFRNPSVASETTDHGTLPGEKISSADTHGLLYPRTDGDEESKFGFWGELDGAKSSSETDSSYNKRSVVMRSAATFCYLCCAFSVMFLAHFGIYFAVDLAFSHHELGTGMSEWILYRHQLPQSTSYGIKFCLETPSREAPRPQTWRYMQAGTDDRCTTDTVDFILNSKETWKVQPGASLVLRNEEPYLARIEQTRTPTVSREQVQAP
ncbi:hypothetical protein G6011_02701 [Alternaria panax]|uniref:Uncharacterized protein n=1 Tax=Alternaria panax TaxID=48097 RepID=A0AAD4FA49_9PLEO|nr:hypothetical protein G6011_02701 [Alternaria panax]